MSTTNTTITSSRRKQKGSISSSLIWISLGLSCVLVSFMNVVSLMSMHQNHYERMFHKVNSVESSAMGSALHQYNHLLCHCNETPCNTSNHHPRQQDTEQGIEKEAIGQTTFNADRAAAVPGHNPLSSSFDTATCLRDVLKAMPIGKGRRVHKLTKHPKPLLVFAHNFDAGNMNLWNTEQRFLPLPNDSLSNNNNNKNCSIWEVGANTDAIDSRTMLKTYPQCTFHLYEPVPKYHQTLVQKWHLEPRGIPHNYGIDAQDNVFSVKTSSLHSEASYLEPPSAPNNNNNSNHNHNNMIDNNEDNEMTEIKVKSFRKAVAEAGGMIPNLFHVNCEGCEWDMLPNLLHQGLIQDIPVIQFGTHNYGTVDGLGDRVWQLCQIRQLLSSSHDMVFGTAFSWERWVIRREKTTK